MKHKRLRCKMCGNLFHKGENHLVDDHVCKNHKDIDVFFYQAEEVEEEEDALG